MAQRLNKKLVVGLTVVGMMVITAAGILLVWNLPGRDPQPAVDQALKLAEKGDYEQACKYYGKAYNRAIAGGDNEAAGEYMIAAGDMALLGGDLRTALSCWGRVLQNDPKHELAQQKIVALRVEQAELYRGEWWTQVRKEAERLIAEDFAPDNEVGLNALGRALIESGTASIEDMRLGGEYLKKAFDREPSNPKFAQALAVFHLRLLEKQIAEAQREGRTGEVVEFESTREQAVEKGLEVYKTLIGSLEKNPPEDSSRIAEAWRRRAEFQMLVGGLGQALLRQKLSTRATPAEIDRLKAWVETHSKQALECLDTALKNSPDDVESLVLTGKYWTSLAVQAEDEAERQAMAAANQAKGKQAFEQAIKIDPEGFDAYFELKNLYAREAELALGRRDRAVMVENLDKACQVLEERIRRDVSATGVRQWRNKTLMGLAYWDLFELNTRKVERMRILAGNPATEKPEIDQVLSRLRQIRLDYVAQAAGGERDARAIFMEARIGMLSDSAEGRVKAINAFRSVENLLERGSTLWVQTKLYQGQLYLQLGEAGVAVSALQAAVKEEIGADLDVAWALLAQALAALPDREADTENAAKQALARNPNNAEALRALAVVYEKQKNWTELERIQEILRGDRPEADVALMEASLLLTRGSDPENPDTVLIAQAQGKLRNLLHDDPSNLQALRMLIATLGNDPNRHEEVADLLGKAEAHVDQKLQNASGQPDGDQVAQLTKLRNSIQYLEVLADPQASDEEKVTRAAEIIRQNPDPFIVALDLYRLYMNTPGRQAEAIQHLKEAHKLKPEDPGVVEMLFRVSISTIKDAEGKDIVKPDWQLAERLAKRAVELGLDRSEGHYYHGQLLFARTDLKDNFVQAEREFRESLKLFPVHSNGQAWLGRALLAQNRLEEAKAAYEQALAQNPRNGQAAYYLAKIADSRGDVESKRKYLDICTELKINDDWTREQMQLIADEQDPASGIARREQTRREKPDDVQNLLALAELYLRADQPDKAKEVLAQCLELQPGDLTLVQKYAVFLRGMEPPDLAGAEAAIRKSMESFGPEDKHGKATAQLLLAAHMETVARLQVPDAPSLESIGEAFIKAAEISEGHSICTDIANHFQRTGRPDQAEVWMRKSIARAEAENNSQAEMTARRNLIETLVGLQDFKRAADIRREIEAYQAKFNDSFGMLAMSEYSTMMGRETSAIQYITQYINAASGGDKALGYFRRGSMNYRRGEWDLAISDLREAKSMAPGGFGYEHRILLARCLQITGQSDQAVVELNSILSENRNVTRASEELYRSFMAAKRYDEAEALVMPLYQADPGNLNYVVLLTEVAVARGDQSRAIQRGKEAVAIAKFDPQVVDKLLGTFLQFGRYRDLLDYVSSTVPESSRNHAYVQARVVAANVAAGDLAKAGEAYERLLSDLGEAPGTVLKILLEMSRLPNSASAVQFVKDQADKHADSPFATLVAAHTSLETGDAQAFQTSLEQLLSRLPANDPATAIYRVTALQGLASLQHREKQFEAARKSYEQILEVAPEKSSARAVALNNLAYMLMDSLNDPAAALAYSEEAARLLPFQSSVLDTFGWNLVLVDEYDRGISLLRRAINVASTITADDILQLAAVHHHAAVALHKRSQQLRQTGQGTQADQDLTEAKLDCRRAHGLLFAVNNDGDGLLEKVVSLGKELGLTLEAELPARPATISQ